MKKLMVFVLALALAISSVGCGNGEGNETMEDFTGIITDVNEGESYIVKVTADSVSGRLTAGDMVVVVIPADGDCSGYAVNDIVKVEFNGIVEDIIGNSGAEKNIPRVFDIERVGIAETAA